ncbi:MAG: hypothetical protein KA094_01480 [Methanoregulaceae archaeon]|jgi:hypothetical protein|nr:hypothetical protein [Methanoregulaceae archaeon]MCC7467808.1 hypothetical protein [Burkholderiaceae bacterium]NLH24841.1 hypothetical protein [Methanomicrobiales archaeon]HPS22038.1 hypothetical protein [Methanoregulaceae archaeon]
MAYFAKEMPLNPDQSLGPVVIGSKIRVENSEPFPLQEGRVEFVPGQEWDPRYLSITKEMTLDRKKLNIHVGLAGTVPIPVYTSLILKQQPITLRVTLIPAMALPGMGIPVAVPLVPVVDEVSVTIPPIPQPELILDGTYLGKTDDGKDGAEVTATVVLPPYISPPEKEELIRTISFEVTDVRNGSITLGGNSSDAIKKTVELIAIPEPASPGGRVTGTVRASVSYNGLVLAGEKRLSFESGKTFILNISPGTLDVTMDKKGSFTARVLEEREGQYYPATDASLSVEIGPEIAKILKVSPSWGQNELAGTVIQSRFSTVKSSDLVVTAKMDDGGIQSGTIKVNLARESIGELVVVFEPESKTSVSPFIHGDSVTVKAKVVPPFGEAPIQAEIEFACANPRGWLVGPKDTTSVAGSIAGSTADIPPVPVPGDEGWESVVFMGNNPVPAVQGIPPAMEQVIVTARKDGVVIGREVVQVGLLGWPMIVVDKERFNFLANADTSREGRPPAVTTGTATVTLLNHGGYPWRIRVEPIGDSRYIEVKETSRSPTSASYDFTLKNPVPRPVNQEGKPGWEQQVLVHTYANLASAATIENVEIQPDVMVQGPDILIRILHEGLFVEATYEYDEQGVRHEIVGKKDLVVRVDIPSEEKYIPPEIKVSALMWDGTNLVPDPTVYIDHVKEPQESKDRNPKARAYWNFIFRTMNGITIEFFRIPEGITPTDSAPVTTSIWKVWISKKIPSNGEILRGHILFFAKKQFDGDLHPDETYLPKFGSMVSGTPAVSFERDTTWQLEVPVELVLGTRGALASEDNIGSVIEEGARCHKIIIESFPQERQKDLVAQIDALPRKSAGDYRKFSESLFDQAHEYWASEQKSYLIWEGVWSTSIWVLEKSVIAGDIAFQVLVGYATKNLGPWTAYFTSTIATTLKNEGVNFYLFYAAEQREMDVCARLYVEREWKTFLEGVVTGAVDATILKDFRIEKVVTDPKRCLRTVAWLWLWKFGRNLYKDPDAGYYVAMKRATEELGEVALVVAIQHYVNENGTKDIRQLFKEARDKGYFGGTARGSDPKTAKPQKSSARSADQNARDAFIRGRDAGKAKVEALSKAAGDLTRNPHDPDLLRRFGKAAEAVQGDKHAMHALNERNPNQQDPLRQQFNDFWKGEYAAVDRATRQRIADQLNSQLKPGDTPYTVDDIAVAGVTNTPPKSPAEDSVKSTYDRDVTYRDNRTGKDVKTGISRDIYNEEFYRQRHNGELPMKNEGGGQVVDRDAVNTFAEHCDQTVTDRYHPDAYGGGPEDIGPAVDPKQKGVPFKDVEATAKAMEYKVEEWYNRAQKAELAGDHIAAEGYKEEGMRQLTKQFKNQVQGRVDKINEITGSPDSSVARVPDDLKAAVDVMNRVGTTGPDGTIFTPADAEAALSAMNTSPKDVASKMSGVVESLQKNAPPDVRKAVEDYVKTLTE